MSNNELPDAYDNVQACLRYWYQAVLTDSPDKSFLEQQFFHASEKVRRLSREYRKEVLGQIGRKVKRETVQRDGTRVVEPVVELLD